MTKQQKLLWIVQHRKIKEEIIYWHHQGNRVLVQIKTFKVANEKDAGSVQITVRKLSDKTTLINICDPQKNYNKRTNRTKSDME